MVPNIRLHEFKLISHLLAPMLLQSRLGSNLRVLNECQTGWLGLILLVLNHVSQIGLLPGLMPFILLPLLNRSEPRLAILVELTVDIWPFD